MALLLNKNVYFLFLWCFCGSLCFSQTGAEPPVYNDYKDPQQFEKFHKRSIVVAAWQLNTLKEQGAIVVRLKTSQLLIDQLLKQGNTDLALQKQLEQYAINKNTMFAYRDNFTFCKVYFMYSNSSDSLLEGARSGIFLDTNLRVDPAIVMTEKFYLVAERDQAYNSSIGFIPEDSARFIKEKGNPVKEMAVVVKNKYGHQLKSPFPYYVKEKNFMDAGYNFPIRYTLTNGGATNIFFPINRTYLEDLKVKAEPKVKTVQGENNSVNTFIKLKKTFTYEKLSSAIGNLNDELNYAYKTYPKPDINRVRPEVRIFLY